MAVEKPKVKPTTKAELRVILVDIVAEQLVIDDDDKAVKIRDESTIRKDLGADSLDVINIMMETEDTLEDFGVKFPDEDEHKVTTFGSFVDLTAEKMGITS